MKKMYELLLAALLPVLLVGAVHAQDDERAAILALTERAFDAVRSGNPDDWRAIQVAEGAAISMRPDPEGVAGKYQMRMTQNEEFAAALKPDARDFVERWTSEPTVLIRGPIAVVWGEYDFRIDGELSHCGVDAFDLVKLDGEWKMVNIMWTVERDNCPTAI